jgi:hypothetical protein
VQLEEGFRDVLKEVKGLGLKKSIVGSDGARSPPSEVRRRGKGKRRERREEIEEQAQDRIGSSL